MTRRRDRIGEHNTALEKNRQIILKTQTICGICGQPVDFSLKYPHPYSASVDHIIPLAKGGHPSDLENLQLAHRCCNRMKSDKLFIEPDVAAESAEITNDELPVHFVWGLYPPSPCCS